MTSLNGSPAASRRSRLSVPPGRPGLNHLPSSENVHYPLLYPERSRTRGWYIAVFLSCLVASVTPISVVYLAWFLSRTETTWTSTLQLFSSQATLWSWSLHIAFLYASFETLFFLHQLYLIALIQTPSPRSRLTDRECRKLFLRVLQSGLGTHQAEALARGSASIEQKATAAAVADNASRKSSPLARDGHRNGLLGGGGGGGLGVIPATPEEEAQVELTYRVDQRLRVEGEERTVRAMLDSTANADEDGDLGRRSRRQSQQESDDWNAALEGNNSREPRLEVPPLRRRSKQLDKVLGGSSDHQDGDDNENADGVRSPYVWVTRLEEDDPKAIEFRERLRNWFGRVPWHAITRRDALTWLSWSCFNLPLSSELQPHQPSSRRMTWTIRLEVLMRMAPLLSFLIQLALIAWGEYQDRHMAVKYTDVDYRVFSDAVHFLWSASGHADDPSRAKGWLTRALGWNIGDPYLRATFRYTPLLPLLLSPMHLLPGSLGPSFGKVVFAALSSFAVPALLTNPGLGASKRATHLLWTLNPMILNINTRGSSEVVLATLVLGALALLKKGNLVAAGATWAGAVHWKLYPIIFAVSIWRWLSLRSGGRMITSDLVRFGLASAATFVGLTTICWSFWGYPFLQHTYLYHIDRLDHRHNFSAYFYSIYLGLYDSKSSGSPLAAFLPQLSSTVLAGIALLPGSALEFVWFAQTFLFVMFNKVCTSQYFIWYLFLLPPIVGHLRMSKTQATLLLAAWVASQAQWLSIAFQLEFRAANVFLPLWAASLVFLATNAFILASVITSYQRSQHRPPKAATKTSVIDMPVSPAAGPGAEALLAWSYNLLEARTGTRFADAEKEDDDDDNELSLHLKQRAAEKAKVMRLTLDPVNALPKPFALYAFGLSVNWLLRHFVYRRMGFAQHVEGNMQYLIRIPSGWNKSDKPSRPRPILYLHGLGFGLLQNFLVIDRLVKDIGDHPIVIPLQPHISMHVTHPKHLEPLSREETIECIERIFERWHFAEPKLGVIILSHSNGSIAHGWLLKDRPHLVYRSAFVDPVVFCLWEGDVCYNFCYRKPKAALELLLHYFIASEVGIANTIQRHFDWSENTLFHDQIPNADDPTKTMYLIGGQDIIIDAYRVKKYLENHGICEGINFDPKKGHGDGLDGPALRRVTAWLATGSFKI